MASQFQIFTGNTFFNRNLFLALVSFKVVLLDILFLEILHPGFCRITGLCCKFIVFIYLWSGTDLKQAF